MKTFDRDFGRERESAEQAGEMGGEAGAHLFGYDCNASLWVFSLSPT